MSLRSISACCGTIWGSISNLCNTIVSIPGNCISKIFSCCVKTEPMQNAKATMPPARPIQAKESSICKKVNDFFLGLFSCCSCFGTKKQSSAQPLVNSAGNNSNSRKATSSTVENEGVDLDNTSVSSNQEEDVLERPTSPNTPHFNRLSLQVNDLNQRVQGIKNNNLFNALSLSDSDSAESNDERQSPIQDDSLLEGKNYSDLYAPVQDVEPLKSALKTPSKTPVVSFAPIAGEIGNTVDSISAGLGMITPQKKSVSSEQLAVFRTPATPAATTPKNGAKHRIGCISDNSEDSVRKREILKQKLSEIPTEDLNTEIAVWSLDKGGATSEAFMYPLAMAVAVNDFDRVQDMITNQKININQQGFSSRTALWYAAANGYTDMAVLLLKHGANKEIAAGNFKSSTGKSLTRSTPEKIAQRNGFSDCSEAIANYTDRVSRGKASNRK